jgi:DNA-binding XRE family transcriptional regulator
MELKDAILKYRAMYNMSMKDFAKKAGLSIQTVNYVEKGLQKPNRLTTEKIMLVLKGEK